MLTNRSFAINLAAIALGMAMLAYASVPLYRLFCQVTGYGGTPREATSAPKNIAARRITVTFNADTDPALPWDFSPGEPSRSVHVGEQTLTHYIAHNRSAAPVTGHATYNVVPFSAGKYFAKIECFCFTEQTLPAHARVDMPVSFYIDPAILNDPEMDNLTTITLSYTFFPVRK